MYSFEVFFPRSKSRYCIQIPFDLKFSKNTFLFQAVLKKVATCNSWKDAVKFQTPEVDYGNFSSRSWFYFSNHIFLFSLIFLFTYVSFLDINIVHLIIDTYFTQFKKNLFIFSHYSCSQPFEFCTD
jgi:hypothetical protein